MRQIGNLTKERIDELWPFRTSDICLMSHLKNEAHCIERMIYSAVQCKNLKLIILLVDDTSTDNTFSVCRNFIDKIGHIKIIVKYFTFENNFGRAKNECIQVAYENGMRDGWWMWFMGGDFECPMKTANQLDKFTEEAYNTITRFYVPEYHPLKNHSNAIIRYLMFWYHPVGRPRQLFMRARQDIKWGDFDFVHENIFHSFYALCKIGDYFDVNCGIKTIGEVIHHGWHEDSKHEKKYKDHKYKILEYCKSLTQQYNFSGIRKVGEDLYIPIGYKNILSLIMFEASRTKEDLEAMDKGWNFFIEHMTIQYMNGNIPKGLIKWYTRRTQMKRLDAEYG